VKLIDTEKQTRERSYAHPSTTGCDKLLRNLEAHNNITFKMSLESISLVYQIVP